MNNNTFALLTREDLTAIIDQAVRTAVNQVLQAQQQPAPKERYTYEEFRHEYRVCDNTIRNWNAAGLVRIEAMGARRYVRIINQPAITHKANGRLRSRV